MKVPSISIIMPLYNKEGDVVRALKSVFAQTISVFEMIVINDGSTDKGPEIVKSFKDPRIRVIDQANAGVSAARNRGISEVTTDLIAFLDADDEWSPDFLKTIVLLHDNYPSCDVFATNYVFKRGKSYLRNTRIRGMPENFRVGILPNYFMIASQSDPPLWTSAVALKSKAIRAIGGFPVGVSIGEDLLTWARLAVQYNIAYSAEPKAYHWEPVELSDRPERVPNQQPDIVGIELKCLLEISDETRKEGLKSYIALWHRMRASIYIRLGNRRKALKEIQKAIGYSGFNLKLISYIALAILPNAIFLALIRCKYRPVS